MPQLGPSSDWLLGTHADAGHHHRLGPLWLGVSAPAESSLGTFGPSSSCPDAPVAPLSPQLGGKYGERGSAGWVSLGVPGMPKRPRKETWGLGSPTLDMPTPAVSWVEELGHTVGIVVSIAGPVTYRKLKWK